MKTLIIYDSIFGNTEKIAKAIGEAFTYEVHLRHVRDVHLSELNTLDLLIVGSPVHGGRSTPALDLFLQNIPPGALHNVKVAAFDTRFASEDHGFGLRLLMNIIRYAAERIAQTLVKKGGKLIVKPEGFFVEEKRGPLKKGELSRATAWGNKILEYGSK